MQSKALLHLKLHPAVLSVCTETPWSIHVNPPVFPALSRFPPGVRILPYFSRFMAKFFSLWKCSPYEPVSTRTEIPRRQQYSDSRRRREQNVSCTSWSRRLGHIHAREANWSVSNNCYYFVLFLRMLKQRDIPPVFIFVNDTWLENVATPTAYLKLTSNIRVTVVDVNTCRCAFSFA